jgi:hypothetical protein
LLVQKVDSSLPHKSMMLQLPIPEIAGVKDAKWFTNNQFTNRNRNKKNMWLTNLNYWFEDKCQFLKFTKYIIISKKVINIISLAECQLLALILFT